MSLASSGNLSPISSSTIKVAIGAGSTQSAALAHLAVYELYPTVDCHIAAGTNPTAVGFAGAVTQPLPGGVRVWLTFKAGWKVAVIQADGGLTGNLAITEMTTL